MDINSVLKDIEKQFGEGSMIRLDSSEDLNVERVSAGSVNLDIALGGGLPRGRSIEIYGPESAGKTTLALLAIKEYLESSPGQYASFIDVEHAFDPTLAAAYGIDMSRLYISQPDNGEQAMDLAEALARSGCFCVIVVDSVSALVPMAEAEDSNEKQSIGLQARLMSKALRKITPACAKNNCSIIWINQIREKMVMYGSPLTTSGGRALAFYASIRIEVKAGEKIPNPSKKDEFIGHIVNCKVVKNKTASPYRQAQFTLIYGVGVDKIAELGDYALMTGVVDKAGSWLRIKDEEDKIIVRKYDDKEVPINFQSKDKFIEYLREDHMLAELFSNSLYTKTPLTKADIIALNND